MSPEPGWPYDVLGLPKAPTTTTEIRRAYAAKLKTIDQATDIPGFTALRQAYEAALARITGRPPHPAPLQTLSPKRPKPAANALARSRRTPPPDNPADQRQRRSPPRRPPDRNPRSSLSKDPDHGPALRHAIAKAITIVSQPGSDDRNLPVSLDQTLLRELDARYGWLSDYTAFARDFPPDHDLLDLMAIRAYPQMTGPRNAAPPGPGNRLLNALSSPRILFFVFLVLIQLARRLTESNAFATPRYLPALQSQALAFAVLGVGSLWLGHLITRSAPIPHIRKCAGLWLALTIALLIDRSQDPVVLPMTLPLALWLTFPLSAAALIWLKRTLLTP